MKRLLVAISIVLVLGGGIVVWLKLGPKQSPGQTANPLTSRPADTHVSTSASNFNKQQYPVTESASLWVITNKKHPLSKGYAPADLVAPKVLLRLGEGEEQMKVSSVMAPALEAMFAAAKKDGIILRLSSGYRSEALQTQFYNSYVARDGVEAADKYSARPGTSEHQTGLAADVIPGNDACHLEICFADTPEGKWVAAHAYEYGFIIRYLKNKESFTTYQYEPWHLRYVGNDLAKELHTNGLTMEEFFNYQ